jgi:hypothetical protein
MAERLTEPQVARIVAEATRLSQLREEERGRGLERAELVEILEQLDLSADLVDDALVEVRRQEALEQQTRRRNLLAVAAVALLLVLLLAGGFYWSYRSGVYAGVSADPGRITRAVDDGGDLKTVTRAGDELYYRVTLRDVPLDESMDLVCNWIDPTGRVYHQNRWETPTTDSPVWPTRARCRLDVNAPTGDWRVELVLDGRVVTSSTFRVE